MPGLLNIERLLGLLREQRREIATRSFEARGSKAWDASSERLDRINERIMRSPLDIPIRPAPVRPLIPPSDPIRRARPHH